jgi:hypothetical protein
VKRTFVFGLAVVVILGVFVLSSCFMVNYGLGTSIYDAEANYSANKVVKVTGAVIAVSPDDGLTIEDSKAGVFVCSDDASFINTFKLGDIITVNATLTKEWGAYSLSPKSTKEIINTGKNIDVIPDDLTNSATLTGHTFRLVKVSGTVTKIEDTEDFFIKTTKMGTVAIYSIDESLNITKSLSAGDNIIVTGIDYDSFHMVGVRNLSDIVKK